MHSEFVRTIDTDVAIAIGNFERTQDLQVTPPPPLVPNAGFLQHINKRLRRAVENGDFDSVDIAVDVIDATSVKSRKKMFSSGEQDALLHQARGVTDARHVAAVSLNFKIVEIHAAEDNARVGWCGIQADAAANGSMKTNSLGFDGALYSRLTRHNVLRCI